MLGIPTAKPIPSPLYARCVACHWERDVQTKDEARYFAKSHTKSAGPSCRVIHVVKRWRQGWTEIIDIVERCSISRRRKG